MSSMVTHYSSYLLRIWTEDRATARILLEETLTRKQYHFASWLELIAFVAGDLPHKGQIDDLAQHPGENKESDHA